MKVNLTSHSEGQERMLNLSITRLSPEIRLRQACDSKVCYLTLNWKRSRCADWSASPKLFLCTQELCTHLLVGVLTWNSSSLVWFVFVFSDTLGRGPSPWYCTNPSSLGWVRSHGDISQLLQAPDNLRASCPTCLGTICTCVFGSVPVGHSVHKLCSVSSGLIWSLICLYNHYFSDIPLALE